MPFRGKNILLFVKNILNVKLHETYFKNLHTNKINHFKKAINNYSSSEIRRIILLSFCFTKTESVN